MKTRRDDILRPKEILASVKTAYETGLDWLSCMMAIACMFGKRINEIISLKKEQFKVDSKFLTIRFRVSKKRDKKSPIPIYHLKRKTLEHPLMPYVLRYIDKVQAGYIFASNRKPENITQTVTVKTRKGETKTLRYRYTIDGGYISRQLAYYYLKKIAPDWWWHLSRESLATMMAEEGATEEELMHWFDWETPATAHKYVKRGTKLTEKWSERTW